MPIPARSQSVRVPPSRSQKSVDLEPAKPPAAVQTGPKPASAASRIPGREKHSVPVIGTGHARSQSSSTVGIPRPTGGIGQISKASSRPNTSIPAAHTRSQSVLNPTTSTASGIQRLQVPAHPLTRTAPQSMIRPPSKVKPTSSSYQQTPLPKRPDQTPRPARDGPDPSKPTLLTATEASTSSRLEDELLQLALVYVNSHACVKEFELSINRKIDTSSSALRAEEEAVRAAARNRQADVNAEALRAWLQDGDQGSKTRKLQDFSFCVAELSDLHSSEGLYVGCMRQFNQWLVQVQAVFQQQTDQADMHLIEPIDHLWTHNMRDLEARLGVCEQVLRGLQSLEPIEGSALAFSLTQFHHMVQVMQSSTAESQSIYESVLSARRNWVANTISNIINTGSDGFDTEARLGAWNKTHHWQNNAARNELLCADASIPRPLRS